MQTYQSTLREDTLRPVRLATYAATLLLLIFGFRGVWRFRKDIDQPFIGVPVSWSRLPGYDINVEVPWNWPGVQHGLRGGDDVIFINGKDPYYFFQEDIFKIQPGDNVTFDTLRQGERIHATVPVTLFTWERWFEIYGFWFLAGLSCALAAVLFIRSAVEETRIVLALTFSTIASAFFGHGYAGVIHFGGFRWWLSGSIAWSYGYLLIGALLLHFALTFPRPPRWLRQRPRLRFIPYMWAFSIGTVYFLGSAWFMTKRQDEMILNIVMATISFGAIMVTLRPIWSYFRPGPEGRQWAATLGPVWSVGVVLLLGVGVLPFVTHGATMILTEILFPLCLVYPLMLVYAVRNIDLIGDLQEEIEAKKRYADEVTELRGIRERTLHEVADALHDTVVADARGLQFWLTALVPRLREQVSPRDISQLTYLKNTLQKIYTDSRRIMEGAKPVDFARENLRRPLQRLVAQANAAGWWEREIAFYADPAVDRLDPATAEDIYWIIRTALNNCRDHAGATQVTIHLELHDGRLNVTVADDGCGFSEGDVDLLGEDLSRRHLGLRNMRMRAQRLNADCDVDSGAHGTAVRLSLPIEEAVDGNDPVDHR